MSTSFPAPAKDIFDDDDDDGWQDMPIVREDISASGLDEEDAKKYHFRPPPVHDASSKRAGNNTSNATGNLIDVDDYGNEWRSKIDHNESEYTRLRVNEEEDADEVHLRTKFLFDEDKAMTPLSQMQATKNLLTEGQRIAYVGLCALTAREMVQSLKAVRRKELKASIANMELWSLKIMGRLYYHMELETQEQKMIESLGEHGVLASDLVPALMTTHTVANPEYDPEEAKRIEEEAKLRPLSPETLAEADDDDEELEEQSISDQTLIDEPAISKSVSTTTPTFKFPEMNMTTPTQTPTAPSFPGQTLIVPSDTAASSGAPTPLMQVKSDTKVLKDSTAHSVPGVSTTLSAADKNVTLDIRWTVLCDLFLLLIADSVYDARSRVLLEQVAYKLGLGWLDVVKFESRVTEALEIQEDIETLEQKDLVEGARKAGNKRRYMMLGLATLGGGLVIGLSAGLMAPVIGLGLAGAFTTIGVTGTGAFLAGTAGAAVITTGGVLTGSGIAAKGMAKRTQHVQIFEILPLHNNKRVSCILTVPGFMTGINDDVRLPFSVLDPVVGDVFSVLWEPDMIRETGSALKILTGEVLSQIGMTVLSATVMTTLMSALQWPVILTKLGYLIDNPWSNALDRAKSAGKVLAEVLIQRHLGVRPITLIGFSLGARVIFYALLELAKQKAFGVVQDVFLLGATLSMSQSYWCESRSVVSGRYVNAFARNDWVLNYLFRATAGGVGTVAGLRPVEGVPGLENVDVTDKIAGHMSYRTFMPLILDQLGFPVFSDFFDEPEEPDFDEDRIVVREGEDQKKSGWFSRKSDSVSGPSKPVQPPPGPQTFALPRKTASVSSPTTPTRQAASGSVTTKQVDEDVDDLPPRMEHEISGAGSSSAASSSTTPRSGTPTPLQKDQGESGEKEEAVPRHAGFDLRAIKEALKEVEAVAGSGGGGGGGVAQAPFASSSTGRGLGSGSVIGQGLPSSSYVPPNPPRSQSTPPAASTSQSFSSSGMPTHSGSTTSLGAGDWGQEVEYSGSFGERGLKSADPTTGAGYGFGGMGRSVSEGWGGGSGSGSRGDGYRKSGLSALSFADDYGDDEDEGDLSTARPAIGHATTTTSMTMPMSLGLPEDVIPSWGSSTPSTGPSWGSTSSPSTSASVKTFSPFGLPESGSARFSSTIEGTTTTSGYGSMPEPFGLTFGSSDGGVGGSLGLSSSEKTVEWSIPPLGFGKKKGSEMDSNPWS